MLLIKSKIYTKDFEKKCFIHTKKGMIYLFFKELGCSQLYLFLHSIKELFCLFNYHFAIYHMKYIIPIFTYIKN